MIMRVQRDFDHATPTCTQKQISSYHYDFVKSYLYRLHSSGSRPHNLEILRLVSPADVYSYRSKDLSVSDDLEGKFLRVTDSKVCATISVAGVLYDVSLFWEQQGTWIAFYIYVFGLGPQAKRANELLNLLLRESMLESPYRNNCLTTDGLEGEGGNMTGMLSLKLAHIENQSLEGILLPDKVTQPVRLFIDAVKQFPSLGVPLRYLFSGRPGTGKTRIIQAIAKEARGYATFIFTSGSEEYLEAVFEFADLFSPLVLCIDDIDLMVGAREEGLYSSRLAKFLQKLDGFVKQDFFLLATANDKRFVDLAARRPGRFDRVIDVDVIDSMHYLPLIRTKTANESVLSLFDDDIIEILEGKHVTGAFIANLVKHLELIEQLNPRSMTKGALLETIEELNLGFSEKKGGDGRVGFGLQN
jgi:hypothetical protein